jgi:adenine-specific DNA-methyltransferase
MDKNSSQKEEITHLDIKSRRYLGSKTKLLDFIKEVIENNTNSFNSFCDLFAGTGVVGNYFNNKGTKIISNDILKSNFISLNCWLSTKKNNYSSKKLIKWINFYNNVDVKNENYFSKHFGGNYFTYENARKIGFIRGNIKNNKNLNKYEKNILITSLIYAMDSVANTCGHYDSFRRNLDQIKSIQLKLPLIDSKNNANNKIYNEDANELIKKISPDVLYLDPPYNSRQYSDAYHLIENVAEWKKPSVFGVAKKMNRDHIKSKYSLSSAEASFKELIESANAKYIILSYNTTESKLHGRSNSKLSSEFIIKILKKKGKLTIFEKDFSPFTTGKTKINDHKERLYFVKII